MQRIPRNSAVQLWLLDSVPMLRSTKKTISAISLTILLAGTGAFGWVTNWIAHATHHDGPDVMLQIASSSSDHDIRNGTALLTDAQDQLLHEVDHIVWQPTPQALAASSGLFSALRAGLADIGSRSMAPTPPFRPPRGFALP